jgi:hypothetical protein
MRPTLQLYFLGLNVVTLAALGLAVPEGVATTVFVVALLVGLLTGFRLARDLDAGSVRYAVLVLAIVGGAVAVLRGLV